MAHARLQTRLRTRREKLEHCRLEGLASGLKARTRELARLRDALAATLDSEGRTHFTGVSANVRKLVIFADSSAWCTRFRYRAPQFEAVAQDLTGIRPQMEFKVQLPMFRQAPAARQALSAEAVRCLESAARSIDDEALARALRRLAGHDL